MMVVCAGAQCEVGGAAADAPQATPSPLARLAAAPPSRQRGAARVCCRTAKWPASVWDATREFGWRSVVVPHGAGTSRPCCSRRARVFWRAGCREHSKTPACTRRQSYLVFGAPLTCNGVLKPPPPHRAAFPGTPPPGRPSGRGVHALGRKWARLRRCAPAGVRVPVAHPHALRLTPRLEVEPGDLELEVPCTAPQRRDSPRRLSPSPPPPGHPLTGPADAAAGAPDGAGAAVRAERGFLLVDLQDSAQDGLLLADLRRYWDEAGGAWARGPGGGWGMRPDPPLADPAAPRGTHDPSPQPASPRRPWCRARLWTCAPCTGRCARSGAGRSRGACRPLGPRCWPRPGPARCPAPPAPRPRLTRARPSTPAGWLRTSGSSRRTARSRCAASAAPPACRPRPRARRSRPRGRRRGGRARDAAGGCTGAAAGCTARHFPEP